MKILATLILITLIPVVVSVNWRRSVKAVLFIVVIEGALRKWLFPEASELIYFLKDVVVIGAYLNYFWLSKDRKYPIKSNLLSQLLILSLVWCLFQVFNPSLGSFVVGLFSMRAYFLYVPLIWMLPTLFNTKEELYKFLRLYLLLAIPVCLLGITQFFSPPTSILNVYADDAAENIATFGSGYSAVVRITGTFSYVGSYTVYLLVCFGFILSLLSIEKKIKWKIILIGELILVFINSMMTGSRTVVFGSAIFLLGFILIESFRDSTKFIANFRNLLLPMIAIIVLLNIWFTPAIDSFSSRVENNKDEFDDRVFLFLQEPINNFKIIGFDSYGTGATHQANKALRNILHLPTGRYISIGHEQEAGRIVLEIGIIGFIVWYALRIVIIFNLFKTYRELKTPFLRQLALSAFLIQLIQLRAHLVFNHTFSVYYWFLTGFIFLLPLLEFKNKLIAYQEKI